MGFSSSHMLQLFMFCRPIILFSKAWPFNSNFLYWHPGFCLSLWIHVYTHYRSPLFIGAFGCRAGVETLLSGILWKASETASARLSIHKEHKILCGWKQGKWAYTETKLQSSETLLHGKNQCHIHAALFQQPSSWMVKISERFYDRFLGIYLMSDVIRELPKPVITHGWIRKRTLSVCQQ